MRERSKMLHMLSFDFIGNIWFCKSFGYTEQIYYYYFKNKIIIITISKMYSHDWLSDIFNISDKTYFKPLKQFLLLLLYK